MAQTWKENATNDKVHNGGGQFCTLSLVVWTILKWLKILGVSKWTSKIRTHCVWNLSSVLTPSKQVFVTFDPTIYGFNMANFQYLVFKNFQIV